MAGPLRFVAMMAIAAAAAQTASAAVTDSSTSGFTIENSVVVPVNAATAWVGLIDHVDEWWPKDHSWWGRESKLSIDARAGGCFCEVAGDRQAQHLKVVFVNPPTLLRMTGGLGPMQGMGLSGVLEWRLEAADGSTRITLWYRAGGYTPEDLRKFAPVVDRVQGLQLGGLADYLRGHASPPPPGKKPP